MSDTPVTYKRSPEMAQRLERSYATHAPGPGQQQRSAEIRNTAKAFAFLLVRMTPPSREQSLAHITALEEAVMWAEEAMRQNE